MNIIANVKVCVYVETSANVLLTNGISCMLSNACSSLHRSLKFIIDGWVPQYIISDDT